jgi:hypothetical protein
MNLYDAVVRKFIELVADVNNNMHYRRRTSLVRQPQGAYAHVDRGGGGRARALKYK